MQDDARLCKMMQDDYDDDDDDDNDDDDNDDDDNDDDDDDSNVDDGDDDDIEHIGTGWHQLGKKSADDAATCVRWLKIRSYQPLSSSVYIIFPPLYTVQELSIEMRSYQPLFSSVLLYIIVYNVHYTSWSRILNEN